MKINKIVIPLLLLLLFSCAEASYDVANYSASFEPISGTSDVKVKLAIEYSVHSGYKTEGYKFVGNNNVRDLKGSDDSGKPVKVKTTQMREKRVEWYFSPVTAGKSKRIIIEFIQEGLLTGQDGLYTLNVDWAGMFKAPVNNSSYILILPIAKKPQIITSSPEPFSVKQADGKWNVSVIQKPLTVTGFEIQYKIGE